MDEPTSTSRPHYRVPRRVATAPISLRESMRSSSPPSGGLVETLYNHPNAKIIAFTASGRAISRSPGDITLAKDEEPGSLSWSSQLERTIAVGPFRIYRAPGSVAFLNCGSALQPILPKSQSWCIDEVNSKFVLQIRRPNYWRIELPVANPEEQHLAESLKGVFDKILQFEKTECPFKRSFTVVLPERPHTPVKKRPWTPIRRSLPNSPTVEPAMPGSPILTPRRSSLIPRSSTSTRGTKIYPNLSESSSNGKPGNSDRDADLKSHPTVAESVTEQHDTVQNLPGLKDQTNLPKETGPPRVDSEPSRAQTKTAVKDEKTPFERQEAFSSSNDSPILIAKSIEGIHDFVACTSSSHTSSTQADCELPSLLSTPLPPDDQDTSFSTESSNQSSSPTEDESLVYILHEGTGYQKGLMKARLRRSAGLKTTRSVTMPTHLTQGVLDQPLTKSSNASSDKIPFIPHSESTQTISSHYSDAPSSISKEPNKEPRLVRRGSDDSFHSIESWHSPSAPMPASPLISRPDSPVKLAKFPQPRQELDASYQQVIGQDQRSEAPSSAGMPCAWETDDEDEESVGSQESVTTAPDVPSSRIAKGDDVGTAGMEDAAKGDAAATVRRRRPVPSHRPTTSSISSVGRRALSPLPPAANLFTPVATVERRPILSKLETVKKIPMAIISKTCEMLIGPPSHLITLMLKVAAKIAAGQWRGLVYGYDDFGEQIPVHWDYSEGEFSDWSDDEPYMGSNHGHGEHPGHHGHHGNQHLTHDGSHQKKAADEPLTEQPESLDDSRNWGVD